MSWQAWTVLALLAVMFTLLIVTKLPAWVIFLGTLTVTMTLGLADEQASLAGFSNSGVLTVAVLFMVAAGMYRTGAITIIADRLIGRPTGVGQAMRRILPPVAVGSAFLNNTPLVAMMIPVVRDLSRSARLPSSKLYMPVSFASILGGTTTLIGTSTNLIIAGLVAKQIASGDAEGLSTISIFTPTLVALPAAVVGLAFILFVGQRLLPEKTGQDESGDPARRFAVQFMVDPDGPLVGRGLGQSGLGTFAGCDLVSHRPGKRARAAEAAASGEGGLVRGVVNQIADRAGDVRELVGRAADVLRPGVPEGDVALGPGDVLTYVGTLEGVTALWTTIGLRAAIAPVPLQESAHTHRLVEVVVSGSSEAVGHRLDDLPVYYQQTFRTKVVGLAVDRELDESKLEEVEVEPGDTIVLEVDPAFLYDSRNEADFALVRRITGYKIQRTSRAPAAAAITLAMILLAAFGVMSMLNAALLATFAMFLTGCLSFRTALKSLELDTIIVLAAAVGLEAAVTGSGLSAEIADLLGRLGGGNPYVALVVIFVGAVVTTNIITNAAAAAFLFPVAVSMAADLEISAMPLVIALMLGTSYALVNPVGYQTNLMVQKPGGYTFGHFAKVGVPLTLLLGVVTCVLTPIFFPFAL
jgi:di/tricarboxylate transporter